MTRAKDIQRAQTLTGQVAIDLRMVLNDARRELEQFEAYVDSWDEQVAAQKEDASTHDPRALTEAYVIQRALEQLESVAHMHSGSTRASNWRRAQTRLIQLAQAAPQHD